MRQLHLQDDVMCWAADSVLRRDAVLAGQWDDGTVQPPVLLSLQLQDEHLWTDGHSVTQDQCAGRH